ncbi:non-ribosomal peptide synthetase [Chryseobacterium sp.]|uniref:non-ribosomal peptide synthetase n=1 Tax=Chryseobacterium sp. TaxID=1871047 RepID=UPI002897F8EA|nr:non-ribosomal peptide synthetase [Chryseobacterium sp.]
MLTKDTDVLSLIEDAVELNPQKTALVYENSAITFAQLGIKSNQLSNYLKKRGVFTDVPLCFCLNQSIDRVIAMLSIWKAGGAYVSLDPLYPDHRLQHILNDTDSPILITQKKYSEKFKFYKGEIVLIDEHQKEIEKMPSQNFYPDISNGLAYLAYTSGSTGIPKAVMAEHKGLGNFVRYFGEILAPQKNDSALNISSSNFDGIVLDLWVPLSLGITTFLYPDNRIVGEALLDYIRKNNISVLPYLPVSILATLPTDQSIGNLRKIFTGGEAPIANVIEAWKKKVELINMYGPTETTVVVCTFKFDEEHPLNTIGKPLNNVDFYVLDEEMKILPVNEVGELYIGGIQVSRGYYNQPELTIERFLQITDPDGKPARIYKTGDLVRRLEDDTIEFVGRADQQVKIRGFRVEPAEIEETIKRAYLVENCVIIIQEECNEKQMICFYKNSKEKETFPEDLRSYLFEKLPSYMIPSKFIEIDNFPLTANGKVDKYILKNLEIQEEKRKNFTAPKTETQQQLALVFSEVLKMKVIGIDDNFFKFGGNSILAYKLISKIRKELQYPLQTSDLFLYPTINELENYIHNHDFTPNNEKFSLSEDKQPQLSVQQQSLWFLDQLHGSTAYNVGALYPLNKHTNIAKLGSSIQKLLKKHVVLRTIIDDKNPQPTTIELSENNWLLQTLHQSEDLQEILQIPFDLRRDYMLRAYVIYENNQPHSLFLIVHHIVTDGWAMPLIIDEINTIYSQSQENCESFNLINYQKYIQWQSQQNQENGIIFWKNYLDNVPVLQIAQDFKKQQSHSDSGKQFCFELDEHLTTKLRKISTENSTTLYTTLLSAFGLLIQYYSGQSDICIGSPSANRPHQFDKTIGYFANMLPIRLKIEGNPTFLDLLKLNREMISDIFQNESIPLETIISHVVKDRFTGHNPLFQHVFVLQNPVEETENSDPINSSEVEWIFNGKAKFDLQFEAFPIHQKLIFNIDYSDVLFKQKTIAEMARAFQYILESVSEFPDQNIGSIDIYSVIKNDKNEFIEIFETPKTFIQLFEDQVKKYPDKTALIFSGMGISYHELNEKSSKIAEILIVKGIKKGDFVACFQDQSIERIISLLGIIKAGAAYVPLDTAYPSERINTILNDTAAKVVISSEKSKNTEIAGDISVLFIEDLMKISLENIRESYSDTHSENDLAYVIHTSGTTGTPKGVLIEHQSLGNFITEYGKLLNITTVDRTLQFSPYNFDGSVIDLWIPLAYGSTVHLYPNNKLLGKHLADFLLLHEISVISFISPSVLSTIPQCIEFPSLKTIGTGAEVCPTQVINHWRTKVKFINMYGPTECTVAVNQFIFDNIHPENTIGTAIKNMQLYVLDQYQRKLPSGVIGELYISGIQLSRGYLNEPELTAEKFIKNPFIDNENSIFSKMYKTGDQMRSLTDGMLEYVGRADHQVKIRGYRIELSEVENAICYIKGVEKAIVLVHSYSESVKSLRAFIVGKVEINLIKNELSRKLPSYMIPNEIYFTENIPLKSNGKTDIISLNEVAEKFKSENQENQEEPANEYERIIKEVWVEVLQRNITNMEDDFFYLGGHSLLLTKLYNRLYKHFPNKLSLSELYINSSIRKLAQLIQERDLNPEIQDYDLGADSLTEEIKKDATIDPNYFQFNVTEKGDFENPKAILLTGVTGFVGVNLLMELLQSNDADIYLLIRAEDENHAKRRLFETMEDQIISTSYDEKRVKFLAGDLAKPYLGLKQTIYTILTQTIDIVYHAGSSVNFIQPYSYMKSANVDALHTMINFVTTHKLKQLSLLSTVGVFSWEHYFTKPTLIKENTDTTSALKYLSRDMGYIQSKWVMEQVAQEAIKQGVPIIIFRLGYVFCHSLTGATAKYQWWSSLIKTCIQLKCYPILIDQKEELTMVDFVSKSIAYISRNPQAIGEIFHLSPEPEDNMTVMDFFEFLRSELNFELKPIPYHEWMQLWENDENSPLYPLLNLFKFKAYDNKAIIEIHQNTPDFDISNTKKFLSGSKIDNTKINKNNVEAFCKYLGIL